MHELRIVYTLLLIFSYIYIYVHIICMRLLWYSKSVFYVSVMWCACDVCVTRARSRPERVLQKPVKVCSRGAENDTLHTAQERHACRRTHTRIAATTQQQRHYIIHNTQTAHNHNIRQTADNIQHSLRVGRSASHVYIITYGRNGVDREFVHKKIIWKSYKTYKNNINNILKII